MSDITRSMVHDAIQAFDLEDTAKAQAVLKSDDDVDRLYNETFRDLLADTSDDADRLNRSMNLILVARSLERIADHATNICEEVIYMVNSEDIRHQH
jgi:phosphate transport system protein